jgi:pimeloyl-ACP methyl ester carboxylesterase
MAEAAQGYHGTWLIQSAGHWVQQEQPERVVQRLLHFLQEVGADAARTRL